jgi:hypothetical protein
MTNLFKKALKSVWLKINSVKYLNFLIQVI